MSWKYMVPRPLECWKLRANLARVSMAREGKVEEVEEGGHLPYSSVVPSPTLHSPTLVPSGSTWDTG